MLKKTILFYIYQRKKKSFCNSNLLSKLSLYTIDEFDQNYAPAKLNALFNGRRVVAYGFIPNCQQAVLKAEVNGSEISTVVTCPELCITKDTILHQLVAKVSYNLK